jgi:hypothetical protein
MSSDPRAHRPRLRAAAGALLAAAIAPHAIAAPVDFNTFTLSRGVPAATFAAPTWQMPSDYLGVPVEPGRVAMETTNSDTNFWLGPSTLTLQNKIIKGDIYFGTDDDPVGLGIGMPQNAMVTGDADYLLLQWKGVTQTFNYADANPAFPFHDSTPGGSDPVGLSLSRVRGTPTADEFWQRADLPMASPDPGGLTQLGRGAFYGTRTYNRQNRRHQFEIHYTPDNIKVWVDGLLEFDINAPPGSPFPEGTLGLYEQAQQPSGAYAYFDVRNFGDPAPPPSTDLNPPPPPPVIPFSGADLSVDAASAWTIARGTPAPAAFAVDSAPNAGDAEFSIGGTKLVRESGVLLATVRQNGPRANGASAPQYMGVEAAAPSGFGNGSGINTFGFDSGGDYDADVSVAHFPYQTFNGGYVDGSGSLVAGDRTGITSPYILTQKQVPLSTIVKWAYNIDGTTLPAHNPPPAGQQPMFFAGNQQVITNLKFTGKNSNTDGLLFTNSSVNEGNYTSVAILPDGSWNVAVRDADAAFYGGPDTFEQDSFAFLYLEDGDLPGSVGGRVTGLNNGQPVVQQSWGQFVLSRIGTGRYVLTITGGDSYEIDILNQKLIGEFSFSDDGGVRTFNNTQELDAVPVDSSFSFAYVPFDAANPAAGGGMLLLNPNDFIVLTDGTVAPLNYFMTYQQVIPEPTATLIIVGLWACGFARRRRN